MKVSIRMGENLKDDILKNFSEFVAESTVEKMKMADVHALTGMGLLIEAFSLKPTSKLYGGYYVIYA